MSARTRTWSRAQSAVRLGRNSKRAGVGAVVIGGDYQGLGIVRSLGARGVPVLVVDDQPSIARVSSATTHALRVASLRDEKSTMEALEMARHRYNIHGWVLYPTRDETVATLSRHRRDLSQWFHVPTPGWEVVEHAWDKRATHRLAEATATPTPCTWYPIDVADLDEIPLRFPVIVKPAVKEHFFYETRAKAWRADTRTELRRLFLRAAAIVPRGEVMVQELIAGDGRHQYAICGFFKDRQFVASMAVRRLRQHPSDFGRASTFVETVAESSLEATTVRLLSEVDYYGLVEVEYKLDARDGEFKLLDINARTWGYHSLGRVAGVDFPYLLFLDQIGRPVNGSTAAPGYRWIRLATDLPNAAVDVLSGRIGAWAYLRSLSRGVHTEAVFSLRDPLPALYEIALLPYLSITRGL